MDLGLNRRAARLADAIAPTPALLGVAVNRAPGRRPADRLRCRRRRRARGRAAAGGGLPGGPGHGVLHERRPRRALAPRRPAVTTDHPVAACLASQYAGWAIDPPGYFAMGSGPARSAGARGARALRADRLRRDRGRRRAGAGGTGAPRRGGGAVRRRQVPGPPGGLRLLIAPTASIAGCVQVAARSVETGLHKMLELGFDVRSVRSGAGVCPLAPVAKNDLRAIGWTNDCILYGTRAYFAVHADDAEVAAMVERLPATTSPDYGTPFYEIFKRAGNDFYKIDRMLVQPGRGGGQQPGVRARLPRRPARPRRAGGLSRAGRRRLRERPHEGRHPGLAVRLARGPPGRGPPGPGAWRPSSRPSRPSRRPWQARRPRPPPKAGSPPAASASTTAQL